MAAVRGKLVRNRVPEIVKAAGDTPQYRQADSDVEYRYLLRALLIDLITEYLSTNDRRTLADVQEVIHTLASLEGMNLPRLVQRRRSDYGSYDKRYVLEGLAGMDGPIRYLRGIE